MLLDDIFNRFMSIEESRILPMDGPSAIDNRQEVSINWWSHEVVLFKHTDFDKVGFDIVTKNCW